jgi:hypothetical protein
MNDRGFVEAKLSGLARLPMEEETSDSAVQPSPRRHGFILSILRALARRAIRCFCLATLAQTRYESADAMRDAGPRNMGRRNGFPRPKLKPLPA